MGKFSRCDFCEEPLQFLLQANIFLFLLVYILLSYGDAILFKVLFIIIILQIYAPIPEKESTFHRMVYVFICPSMSCLLQDQHEQWKRREEDPRRRCEQCSL